MTATQQQFPEINSRFVDPEGRILQGWLQLLISLWNRTGQQQGVTAADIQYNDGQVAGLLAALREELQQQAVAKPPAVSAEAESPLVVPPPYPFGDLLQRIQDAEMRVEAKANQALATLEQLLQDALAGTLPERFPFIPETGSWTPVLTFATPGDLAVTYAADGQTGRYTKLGDEVTLWGRIVTSAFTHTTAAGAMQITGVPVAALNVTSFDFMGKLSWEGITKANYTEVALVLAAGASTLTAQASGSGQALSDIAAADMPTGGTVVLEFTITYKAPRA